MLLILITVFSFSVLVEKKNSANSVEGDRQVLMDLYEATGGRSWSNNSGWGSGNPSGSWYGVEIDADGRVVRLDLQGNGLGGQLPETIGNLTRVRYFNVVRNNLSGEIPSTIGNLSSVEWLRLSGTGGDDLDNVGHHPSKSDDSGNSFSGTMPPELGQLQNMKYLQIGGNNFSGGIPAEIGDARNLIGLYLNWGNLSGSIPAEIGNLSNLRFLHLRKNNLSGSLPSEIGNLSKLQVLRVNFNELTGGIPDSYRNLTNLMWAVFDENDLSGNWPHWWNNGNFTQINTLRGEWNNFTGTLHGFDNLPKLKSFSVTGNEMEGELPSSMTVPTSVVNFTFGWNNFEGQIPQQGWGQFRQMRQLRLNNNNLEGPIPDELPNSSNLKYLFFNNNNFSGPVSTNHGKYADSGDYPVFNYMNISNNNFSSSDYKALLDILSSSKLIIKEK